MARGLLWNAFLSQLELSDEALGQLFGLPRRLLGRTWGLSDASWSQLGALGGIREPNLEAPSAPGR